MPKHTPMRRTGAFKGAIAFGDLVGQLDLLRVACRRCPRSGQYRLAKLIERYGAGFGLPDWIDELTSDCPLRPKPGTIWNR
jgi:hypothetical protein